MVAALVFWRLLPPARHFVQRSMQPRSVIADVKRQFDAGHFGGNGVTVWQL